tara:strand:- start:204 stop:326 length:123 start_codon:yes stop_codon:yes gene_type:complete
MAELMMPVVESPKSENILNIFAHTAFLPAPEFKTNQYGKN